MGGEARALYPLIPTLFRNGTYKERNGELLKASFD